MLKFIAVKMDSSFNDKLRAKWNDGLFVCVGLDTDHHKLPSSLQNEPKESGIYKFNKTIIDATSALVCAYKLNTAFYEAEEDSWRAMAKTISYIQETYPEIPIILDAKRGDIGNTNLGYVHMAFGTLKVDAITVSPYLGKEALKPFLENKDKGIIILVRTSNPGAGEFQDLEVEGKPLYQIVAEHVASDWNENGNCAVVVGSTFPEELKKVREIIGDMPILVPGIGAQGGDLEATLKNGMDSNKQSFSANKQGLIISSSRGIIYASSGEDFAEAAKSEVEKMNNQIKEFINAN